MKLLVAFTTFLSLSSVWCNSTLQELTERQNFLTELLVRIQTETILNHESNSRITACQNKNNRSADCEIARNQVFAPFPEVVNQARLHLALGYRDGFFGGSFTKLNSGLGPLGTYKDVSWEKLTANEEKIAQAVMDKYIAEGRTEARKNPKVGSVGSKHERFVQLYVRTKRMAHLQLYKDLLSQIVLLQYMSDERVNSQTLGNAFAKLMERSRKEVNQLSRTARIAENWIKTRNSCAETIDYQLRNPSVHGGILSMSYCIQTPSALLSLLDYKGAVDGLVMDYPQFAKVAKSLRSEKTARAIVTGAFIVLPTLAVCILAPPMIAVTAGAAAGGLSLLLEHNNYNQIRRRELSKVVNPEANVDWEALKMGRLSRNISAVLLPFFGAGKYISPMFKSGAPAARYMIGLTKFKNYRFTKK
jgi:hypothetical protein